MAEHRAPPRPPRAQLAPEPPESPITTSPIHHRLAWDSQTTFRHGDSDDDNYEHQTPDRRDPATSRDAQGARKDTVPTVDQGRDQDTKTPEAEKTRQKLSKARTAIRNFGSPWLLVPQSTGAFAIVLFQIEGRPRGLDVIAYMFWALAVGSLALGVLLYGLRLALFPRHVGQQLMTNPAELVCTASASIALTSCNQMLALVRPGADPRWAPVTAAIWWFNVAAALACMLFIPYALARLQRPPAGGGGVAQLSPATLMPMVAAVTLAGCGAVVAAADGQGQRQGAEAQTRIVFVSLLALALSLPLTLAFSTVYLVRLLDGSMPARDKVYQDMILAGPWGQGSFALQLLGQALVEGADGIAVQIAGGLVTPTAVRVLGYSCIFLGFLSWGQATFWWAFAVMSCVQSHVEAWNLRRIRWFLETAQLDGDDGDEEYTLAAWALVFPWAVYTNASIQLGKTLGSPAFRIWSSILTVCLAVLTLVNLALTVKGLWTGRLLGVGRQRPTRLASSKMPASYT